MSEKHLFNVTVETSIETVEERFNQDKELTAKLQAVLSNERVKTKVNEFHSIVEEYLAVSTYTVEPKIIEHNLMVNAMHAALVEIGENPKAWDLKQAILDNLTTKLSIEVIEGLSRELSKCLETAVLCEMVMKDFFNINSGNDE